MSKLEVVLLTPLKAGIETCDHWEEQGKEGEIKRGVIDFGIVM